MKHLAIPHMGIIVDAPVGLTIIFPICTCVDRKEQAVANIFQFEDVGNIYNKNKMED